MPQETFTNNRLSSSATIGNRLITIAKVSDKVAGASFLPADFRSTLEALPLPRDWALNADNLL
jgi:hypothetical protein